MKIKSIKNYKKKSLSKAPPSKTPSNSAAEVTSIDEARFERKLESARKKAIQHAVASIDW